MSAWRSSSARSGGFILRRVSSVRTSSSVIVRWCGLASQVTATPRALASRIDLDRLARREVLDVDPRALVAGQRAVAGDHRRLADARDAGDAEQRADDALVHRALARQRRVLLVQREHAAAQALVLQRAAKDAGVGDRPAVVGEAGGAERAQLGHVGQLAALQAARDRRHEADRHARLARGGVEQRAEDRRAVDRPATCSASR